MKAATETKSAGDAFVYICISCFFFYLLFLAGRWTLRAIDESGWWSRNHDTPIFFDGSWLVGEYRACGMLTDSISGDGFTRTTTEIAHLPELYCGRAAYAHADEMAISHVMPVKYHGRIKRAEWSVNWRCQRNQDSLTCWALN